MFQGVQFRRQQAFLKELAHRNAGFWSLSDPFQTIIDSSWIKIDSKFREDHAFDTFHPVYQDFAVSSFLPSSSCYCSF